MVDHYYQKDKTFSSVFFNIPIEDRLSCHYPNRMISSVVLTNEKGLPQISEEEGEKKFKTHLGRVFVEKALDTILFAFYGGVEGAKNAMNQLLRAQLTPLRGTPLTPAQKENVLQTLNDFYANYRNEFHYGASGNSNDVCEKCMNYYDIICADCYHLENMEIARTPISEDLLYKAVSKFVSIGFYPPVFSFSTFI